MGDVQPIPAGYPVVTPYLYLDRAAEAIDWYGKVFGAVQRGDRMTGPDGKVGHAELQLGDSVVMLADEFPDMGACAPRTVGGTPVALHVYVEDVDTVFARAVDEGATVLQPVEDRFYGDRSAQIEDPFGHRWSIATHVEDVPEDEMRRRAAEAMGG